MEEGRWREREGGRKGEGRKEGGEGVGKWRKRGRRMGDTRSYCHGLTFASMFRSLSAKCSPFFSLILFLSSSFMANLPRGRRRRRRRRRREGTINTSLASIHLPSHSSIHVTRIQSSPLSFLNPRRYHSFLYPPSMSLSFLHLIPSSRTILPIHGTLLNDNSCRYVVEAAAAAPTLQPSCCVVVELQKASVGHSLSCINSTELGQKVITHNQGHCSCANTIQ